MPSKVSVETWKRHIILLLVTSWPNILTFLIQQGIPVASTVFVGNIGPSVLIGASALGNMFGNASGLAICSGLSMALDTLCSQAFGAKKYMLVGLHCQRAMVILTLICIPVSFIWYNAHFVLQFIGTAEVAELSQRWLRILIPALWPRAMYEAYRRYLLGQRILWPITLTVAVVTPLHILNSYLLVFKFGFGFDGAAYAVVISYWLLFIFIYAISTARVWYLRRKSVGTHVPLEMTVAKSSHASQSSESSDDNEEDEEEIDENNGDPLHSWPKWSLEVFKGWGAFLRLGAATAASLFIEWGSFEVNAAIAAYLGEVSLATHAILSNFAVIWYAAPNGIAAATTAWVGNTLGAGEADRAWIFARIGFGLNFTYGLVNGGCGMIYREAIARTFTSDQAVIDLVVSMVPVMWLYGLVDALKALGMGVLRGSGRPAITVLGNILSCLAVGYPVALLLVFVAKYQLHGLWLGMSSAWLVASSLYAFIISRTNWQQEVEKAAARNREAMLSRKTLTPSVHDKTIFTISGDNDNDEENAAGEDDGGEGAAETLLPLRQSQEIMFSVTAEALGDTDLPAQDTNN